tara:strand:- start:3082 stop:4956 length:1875 start_codon:yes stop_codon:yes gene_type:complete
MPPPKSRYLDKLNDIINNNNSVTYIVTSIILFTFFIFILIIYNFLSKASTNCNNIDKDYKEVYSIDENNNLNDVTKILTIPQENREIDISFSMTLSILSNLYYIDSTYINRPDRDTIPFTGNLDSPAVLSFDNNEVNNTKIISIVKKENLKKLVNIQFEKDNLIDDESFQVYFPNDRLVINDVVYYKLTCKNTFYQNTETIKEISTGSQEGSRDINPATPNPGFGSGYRLYYLYDNLTINKKTNVDDTLKWDSSLYGIIAISDSETDNHIYIDYKYVKIQQNTFKYTYTTIPDTINQVTSSRDIQLLNNGGNIEQILNKIHNNFILTAFNCCNSGEYQNNYVDTCILKKCLNLGIRCLDFQIFNYNQKPIIASSTLDSLYIKETFNYLELEPVLEIITNYLNNNGKDNTSPLFLHFRVMSLSEKIYKLLIRSILEKLGNDQEKKNNYELVIGLDNINTLSLNDFNKKIVVFINPYYTANNSLINQLDNYINEEKNAMSITANYKIYKSGNILNSTADLILYKNNNYDIYKDSHNKTKLTLVLPESNNKNNDESFVKYMQHNITFIPMKFQEVDNFLQVAIHIFTKNDNNTGFMLKNSIDSSIFEININPESKKILYTNTNDLLS